MAEKLAPEKHHAFVHNGRNVFERDQTLEEVNMYIELPKGVPTKLFRCTIQAGHVEVGIRGNPTYLNHDLTHPVKTDSSFWTIGQRGPDWYTLDSVSGQVCLHIKAIKVHESSSRALNNSAEADARRRISLDKQGPTVVHENPGHLRTIFGLPPDERD